jgi:WD40 repeat protein
MNIFISYSSKSRAVVEALAVDLEALGYTVWFDRELTGGLEWWEAILNRIRRCHLFLFALTPEAMASYPCQLEYDYATALHKRVLPVMLTNINISLLPSSLQKYQIVDYRQQNKQQALALGKALNSLPPAKALPKPLPPKPEMPLPPLTRIRDQIDATTLKSDEQRHIVTKLKEFLDDPETASDARMLLRRMRDREDLLARIEKEINGLLNIKAPPRATAKRQTVIVEPRVFVGHSEPIFGVAFAPDNEVILTGSVDGTARLWDIKTCKELKRFVGHAGSVWNVAFSPNGRTILTASRDKTARLWDVKSGDESRQLIGHTESVWGVAFSPDGHTILTGSFDKTARLWDFATGKELAQICGHTAAVWGVAFSPDGRTVLTGSWDKTARLWEVPTGKELQQFVGHGSPVVSVTYSPDGHTLLTNDRDNVARLWDIRTGKEICRFMSHLAFSVTYSPDGRLILTGGGDKTARLWESQIGKELYCFTGHTDAVTSVAFAPDGASVLTGSADKTARLWPVPMDKDLRSS